MTRHPRSRTPGTAAHALDAAKLDRYLKRHLPALAGIDEVVQFQGGQSNPTFRIRSGNRHFVLRKKPAGTLLPSAHAIEREYIVLTALRGSGIPVPAVHLLCEDPAVLGQPFYLMDFVEGRIFADVRLPDCSPFDRSAIFADMNRVLAMMHRLDWRAIGLAHFSRPGNYFARQVRRWAEQYRAAQTDDVPEMDRLIDWLGGQIPSVTQTAIVHGDFRLGNLIFHPTENRVAAILDWELATLGEPLSDLAYNCLAWRLPEGMGGFGPDLPAGIPTEAEYVARYGEAGSVAIHPQDLEFLVVFAMFRMAAINAGVYKRGVDGNAADPRAAKTATKYKTIAALAWATAQRGG